MSPHDLAYDVQGKVEEYLRAGVRLVWIIYPTHQAASAFRPDAPGVTLRPVDELDGAPVLPGFRVRLAELCALPPGMPTGDTPA